MKQTKAFKIPIHPGLTLDQALLVCPVSLLEAHILPWLWQPDLLGTNLIQPLQG